MENEPRDPLDSLLRQWAQDYAPDEFTTRLLRDRVTSAVWEGTDRGRRALAPRRRLGRGWDRPLWFVAGAAAAVLVMLAFRGGSSPQQSLPDGRPQADDLSSLVRFPQAELAEKSRLLGGLEEVFNGDLAWVAEVDSRVQLGLLPGCRRLPGGVGPLAVRVVVLSRKAGEEKWQSVWETDLVTHDQQWIQLAPEQIGGAELRVWTQWLPDGMIAVDADLALSGSSPVRTSSSRIQRGGVPERIFSLDTGDAEYRVYQTVALLSERDQRDHS